MHGSMIDKETDRLFEGLLNRILSVAWYRL